MRLSSVQGRLSACIAASMLLMAPAYAVDHPDPMQINGMNPANAPTLGSVQVTATAPVDVISESLPMASGTQFFGVRNYLRAPAYLRMFNNNAVSVDKHKNKSGCEDDYGDPIQISQGSKIGTYTLFSLPGEMGLTYELYYNTTPKNGFWRDNLSYSLDTGCNFEVGNNGACYAVKYYRADGSTLIFDGMPGYGPFTEEGGGGLATLTYDSGSATYTLHDEDATTKLFGPNGFSSVTDASGIGWTLSNTTVNGNNVRIVTHTNGQSYTITPGPTTTQVVNGQTVTFYQQTITDPAGNNYTIVSSQGNYDSITLPGTPATVIGFKYTTVKNSVLTEVDYNGVPHDYTTYVTTATDPYFGWANGTHLADNSEGTNISYSTDTAGNVQATLINALGHQTIQTYDGTNGSGGGYNGQLSLVSDNAVATCGSTVHGRSYDTSGNLSETIDSNGNVHTYTYASTGQLQTETEAYGTPLARTTDYVWDPTIQLNRLLSETVEGWKKTVYTYNANNRVASAAVTNLSSNGSANQTLTTTYGYTLYGNGMVQTMTVTHPSPNGSNTDTYSYDALGHLTALSNGLGQATSYSNYNGLGEVGHIVGPNGDTTDYTYDARGRVATKTTYPGGSATTWTYAYDGFGLLYTLTGPDGQVTTWNRDATMRVQTVTHNDKDGTSTESFSYDANGDVLEHKVSRGSTVGLDEIFHYDAFGRVYQKIGQNGQSLTYAYDGNGNVLSTADAVGHTVAYQYDALNRVTQKSESGGASPALPSPAPTLNAPSSNTNGTYTVSWNSITGATSYWLQEQVNGGAWNNVQGSSALSWSASGKADATYGYRVYGCNVTGCSPWSSTVSTTVLLPPPTPTNVVGPATSSGVIPLTWNASPTATSYDVHQSFNGGTWTMPLQGVSTNAATITATASGNYQFFITANNASGWSGQVGTSNVVVVTIPPATVPTLTVPANNSTGTYALSWTAIVGATSYNLQEQVNGGAWTTVQSTGATSWGAAGKSNGTYAYQVQACNAGGCTAWSPVGTTTVLLPPGSAPSVSSPANNGTGSYSVSWSTITGATSYTLQEQVNGGAWATVQSGGATSWAASGKANGTYGYQVQSCNAGGCSGWSSAVSTSVLLPPPTPTNVTGPATSNGSISLTWSASPTATSYDVHQSFNGGAWTLVKNVPTNAATISAPTSGNYQFFIAALNASGWNGQLGTSNVVAVTVPPATAPTLTVPGSSTTGSYTVNWTAVTGATSYNLQEQINGGAWNTAQSSGATSWGAAGKSNGTYAYQVQACNVGGCGPWSSAGSVAILLPPAAAPALSVPARNYSGGYTISWGGVGGASSYTLQEQVNGGAWANVQANGSTSWSTSGRGNGTYGYQVIACNASGCGPWSGVGATLVIIPTPIAINGQAYKGVRTLAKGGGGEGIGFDIANGNTWEVYKVTSANVRTVIASGALPPGASTVQYTWGAYSILDGSDAGGSIVTNGASSPVSVSSNPGTEYDTDSIEYNQGDIGRQYSFRVDFYDVTGTNISSSTCTLSAEVLTAM